MRIFDESLYYMQVVAMHIAQFYNHKNARISLFAKNTNYEILPCL